jgi:hydrogenase expression/formation protein HypE
MKLLPVGKIDMDILERLISSYTQLNERVVVGSGIGEDAAAIDMGSSYLIAKTDPITHVSGEIGHYVVNINANDIAAMGGTPRWFLATILVPESSKEDDLEKIFAQISDSCKALGIAYCGGHTEVTTSVNNPVVIGQMLGEVGKADLKPTSGAREGDDLILTKRAAIEATSIIAIENAEELKKHFPEELIKRAQDYLHDPGISIVKDASLVSRNAGVHALHDPTEGGIATGIYEMARASNAGVDVHYDKIPISEETSALCAYYQVDPLGTFASGSLLIATHPAVTDNVIRQLTENGIPAACVGSIKPKSMGMNLIKDGEIIPLPVFHQDELSRIFG